MTKNYQTVMKNWFIKGRQRIIPTHWKHEVVKLVGCLDYETGCVYVEDHKNTMLRFSCSSWKMCCPCIWTENCDDPRKRKDSSCKTAEEVP